MLFVMLNGENPTVLLLLHHFAGPILPDVKTSNSELSLMRGSPSIVATPVVTGQIDFGGYINCCTCVVHAYDITR